jgi:hypothetical protein
MSFMTSWIAGDFEVARVSTPTTQCVLSYLTHWEGERQDEATWEKYEQCVTDGVVARPLLDFIQQQQQQQQQQQAPEKGKSVTPEKSKPSRRKLKAKFK